MISKTAQRGLIITFALLVLLGVLSWKPNRGQGEVVLGGESVVLDVADTRSERVQGLSGRTDIGEGMAFCMLASGEHRFWMKEMFVDLDVVGIEEGRVVWLEQAVMAPRSVSEEPRVFYPEGRVILELPIGAIERYGLLLGDAVETDALCGH